MLRALVTGVSSGIGAAIALELLESGYHVTGLSRRRPDISAAHLEPFDWVQADLGDLASLEVLARGLTVPRVFVYAAGFMQTGALGELDPRDLAGMLAVHLQAPSLLLNEFAPAMERGSRVVLIGSRTMAGVSGKSQYLATKSALVGLSRSWAIELADRAITCNVVAPGLTDTPMMVERRRAGVPPQVLPLGALVDPRDVAARVGFLTGDRGKSITGQVLTICGGASLKG